MIIRKIDWVGNISGNDIIKSYNKYTWLTATITRINRRIHRRINRRINRRIHRRINRRIDWRINWRGKIGESNILNIIVITDNKMSYHGCHLQHGQLIKNSKSIKHANIYIGLGKSLSQSSSTRVGHLVNTHLLLYCYSIFLNA